MRTSSSDNVGSGEPGWRSARLFHLVFILVAVAYAVGVGAAAYDRLIHVNQAARERLIREHRLWEVQPDFRGRPEVWARMASRLLNDRQLLARMATKYGGASEPLELEYRRDLVLARAEVVLSAFGIWAAPLIAIYGVVWAMRRRKPKPPQKLQPASASDPRYLPPGSG